MSTGWIFDPNDSFVLRQPMAGMKPGSITQLNQEEVTYGIY